MQGSARNGSPAMAVAVLALFVSLGGMSYAVAIGSIGSREIRDGAVKSRDLANGTVQSRDVRDGGLQGRDVANGTVRSRDVRDGGLRGVDVGDGALSGADVGPNSLGDREIDEPQLDINRLDGFAASRYVRNVRRVAASTAEDPAILKSTPPATCPKGTTLIGGGAEVIASQPVPVALSSSSPSGRSWTASAYATSPTANWRLVSVAICG